jgi:hypothetical protein
VKQFIVSREGFEARSVVRVVTSTASAGLKFEKRDGATRDEMANPSFGTKVKLNLKRKSSKVKLKAKK